MSCEKLKFSFLLEMFTETHPKELSDFIGSNFPVASSNAYVDEQRTQKSHHLMKVSEKKCRKDKEIGIRNPI